MGELRLPLALGHPPADTAVFAPVMAALQELQVSILPEFINMFRVAIDVAGIVPSGAD